MIQNIGLTMSEIETLELCCDIYAATKTLETMKYLTKNEKDVLRFYGLIEK